MQDAQMMFGGQQVAGTEHFEVRNPSTGAVVGRAPIGRSEDLEAAVAAARKGYRHWSTTDDATRQAACLAIADRIEQEAEALAALITQEQGKPLDGLGSRYEVGGAIAWARYAATVSLPVKVLQDDASGRIELHRKPIGVVGSITPWNWPLMIAVWHILPAVRTGNATIIKPSPYTPLATVRLVELMNEVLPPGVVNVVTADDVTVPMGALMSAHPGIDKIVFTGSIATGRKVMASAAGTMKRLTLELGGNDAGIVLPDADPGAIAEGLFWSAFINNGQTCAALKRLYVHDAIYDDVCTALADYARKVVVGDGLSGAQLGPLTNQMQFDKVARLVADARGKGRVLVGGAPGEGLFFPPTLIADLDHGVALVDEEQFGPALPIIRYHDVEEAIAKANASDNGLGGSVWSSDLQQARAVAMRLECGSVWINRHGAIQPNAPFGGTKQSGFGVEFGEEGMAEYTTLQTVFC